jgi:hypothetical protein
MANLPSGPGQTDKDHSLSVVEASDSPGVVAQTSIDAKLPAAGAAADDESNATSMTELRARLLAFDGTTWDRIRSGITTIGNAVAGFLNAIPWAFYNATPTTRTSGLGGPLQTDKFGALTVSTIYFEELPMVRVQGAPLVPDADPNTAGLLPSDARVVPWPSNGFVNSGTLGISILGGTNLTYRPWIYDTASGKWVTIGGANVLTTGAGQGSALTSWRSKKLYCQITAVTGAVTDFFYGLI